MADYVDPYCPFCRTEGRVVVYSARTSAFDTLYRCGLCYKVFDQKDRDIQEQKNRQRKKVEPILPVREEKPTNKKNVLFVGSTIFLVIMAIYFF